LGPGAVTLSKDSFLNQCLEQAGAGNQAALVDLYHATSDLVHGLALRILGDTFDAEEVALDVYTHVWRNLRTFDPERGTVMSWLVMLTRSRSLDRLRSRNRRREREQPIADGFHPLAQADLPDQIAASREEATRLRAALAALSPVQRQALELAYFGGLSQTEIATRLKQPVGTVKTRIRQGLLKLRQSMNIAEPGKGVKGCSIAD
jgi:RNA polymerase sigma-70 factor, ECF subfamily